jgi:hypothetical protein
MVKASELRIDNWLQETTASGKIHYFKTTILYMEVLEDEPDTFDPIPLTAEILEASGFSWTYPMEDKFHTSRFKHFYKDGFYGALYLRGDNCFEYTMNNKVYPYLHQLQNLYFILTGEELEIKLAQPLPMA